MDPTTFAIPSLRRKRQKLTTTACEPCRNRKIRCDGNKPSCEACSKRSQQCIYQVAPDTTSSNAYVDSLVSRVAQLEQELTNARTAILQLSTNPSIPTEPPQQQHQHHHQHHQPLSNIDPRLLPEDERAAAEHSSVDAMGGDAGLVSPDDSQTFYGSSSALGFTRQLYGSILQKDKIVPEMNASEVTSSAQHLPSSSTAANVPPENFSLLPRELSDRLLSLYWDRVHTLYPFLHKDSFNQAYEDLWKPSVGHQPRTRPGLGLGASKDSGPSSIVFHCAFNAALALGMQFSDLPLSERERLSSACLAKSKDLLRFDLFDDGSIALVQTLLLLTQYFQSTNWPSKCWTSIGLACRLAQGLGLHIEESQSNQKFEIGELEMRRRVWHGCVTMDIIVSMTLGRPAMLVGSSARSLPQPVDTCNEVLVVKGDDTLFSIDFFTETVKLYRIVGRILLSIYKIDDDSQERPEHAENAKKDEIVRDFEHELALFAQKIPKNLMWRSPPEPYRADPSNDTAVRQSHVLHVRFLHAHILLLRPLFLQFCRENVSSHGTTSPTVDPELTVAGPFHLQYALTCVRTALELIDSVKIYSATDLTGAWWYNVFYTRTAGMVVLLSGICPPICDALGDEQWQQAWASCVGILTESLPQYKSVKGCLATLHTLRQNILRQRSGGQLIDDPIISPSEQTAGMHIPNDQTSSGNDAASSLDPAVDHGHFLLDSVFDLFTFVESDLFADYSVDLTQPSV